MALLRSPGGGGLLRGPNGHPTSDVECCICEPPPPPPPVDCCACDLLPDILRAQFHGIGCTGWGLFDGDPFVFTKQGQDSSGSSLCIPAEGDPYYWEYETPSGDIFQLCCEGSYDEQPDGTVTIAAWFWWCNNANAAQLDIFCNRNTGTITAQIGEEGNPLMGGILCVCPDPEPFWITIDDGCLTPTRRKIMNIIRGTRLKKDSPSPERPPRVNVVPGVNTNIRRRTLGDWFRNLTRKLGTPHRCGCDYAQLDIMQLGWWQKEDTIPWMADRLEKEAKRLEMEYDPDTILRVATLLTRKAIHRLRSPVGS